MLWVPINKQLFIYLEYTIERGLASLVQYPERKHQGWLKKKFFIKAILNNVRHAYFYFIKRLNIIYKACHLMQPR